MLLLEEEDANVVDEDWLLRELKSNVERLNYLEDEQSTRHLYFVLNHVEEQMNYSNCLTINSNSDDDDNDEVNDQHYREERVHWEIYVEIKEKMLQQMPKMEDLSDEEEFLLRIFSMKFVLPAELERRINCCHLRRI